MRNLGCVIVMIFMSVAVFAQHQMVNIVGEGVTIEEAFGQIEAQSKFSIAYNQTKFNAKEVLTHAIGRVSIDGALGVILSGSGFGYKVNGSHIIIQAVDRSSSAVGVSGLTQTIRGCVRDAASGLPVPFATVALLNTVPVRGEVADSLGRFSFKRVPIGRHDIQVSMIGYEAAVLKEVLVISAKESYNEVAIVEQAIQLNELVVTPQVNKQKTLNVMSLTGGRMFSVEEANRYAGGFDDPARLISSFAGVTGGSSSTALSIHGNSPQFLQWRLEGVEIPAPSHFTDMAGAGGGIYTALSSQVMGNSDFFNGAFPAEYNNALSGVFDMSMRNGNNQQHEHTFQVGILGVDIASEGPLNRESGSSYIFNYRYFNTAPVKSFTGDLSMAFHDLSFKFNFPTRRAGTFAFWGFGVSDIYGLEAKADSSEWNEPKDAQDQNLRFNKLASGLNHKIYIGGDAYIKTSLAATYAEGKRNMEMHKAPLMDMFDRNWNISFNSYLNKKFSARHTNRTGVKVTGLVYDLDYNLSPSFDLIEPVVRPMNNIAKGGTVSSLYSVFSSSLFNITDRLVANVGLTSQFFALNSNWSVEPRVSLKYKVAPKHSFAVAYGLHSKHEKLDYYYIKTAQTGDRLVNMDLKFAKAHHVTLSYDWSVTDNIHLRVEPYYQYLYDVPVEAGTSFSIINHTNFYLDKALVNDGKGRNYGVDVTLERYLKDGYYWMVTGSLFDSQYMGGDGVWRDTRYNRKFVSNVLVGKEWMCGRQKQHVFSANIGLLFQGGEYLEAINAEASVEQQIPVFDQQRAYLEQLDSSLGMDVSVGYKINRKKVSHEFAVKVLNATATPDQYGYLYNTETKEVERNEMRITIPNISYKIHF
jgi:hypothetical protein